ncbi:TetR/AcrR family transcriptional regulator, partial [Oceanospirillum sp. HFRX-1_2]
MKMLKDDWLSLGLELLVEAGVAQVKIDPLCQRAGATKGSFYHHFKNREVFLTELLNYWQQHYSQQLIDKV